MRRLAVLLLTLISSLGVSAAHLVGGEITYECLGNDRYRITLRIYRDCNSQGAQFDQFAAVTIFDSNGNIEQNLDVGHGPIRRLPATINNPCLQSPPNVCTEYTDYVTTVTLPPQAGGYTITHQRCCRNNTIDNIPNPGDWGNTYTVSIPSNDNCNSTPTFNTEPPIVMCLNDPLVIDSSVSEPDGDSVYYELCTPLHGGGTDQPPSGSDCPTCPAPDPAVAPPYTNVPFIAPRTPANPIPSNPTVTINPNTGLITGTPTQLGQFVFAICVQEYRNGQLLSTIRRDYQFNVTNCQSNVRSGIELQDSASICVGTTVLFEEDALNAVKYFWDFGDPNSTTDTSIVQNPVYTYADTGTYIITLIVNKGFPCADTATTVYQVNYPVSFTFNEGGSACLDDQNFRIAANGNFSSNATFNWTFPPEANIQTHNTANPPPLEFTDPGTYYVELTVSDFGCTTTIGDSIAIGLRPEFSAVVPDQFQCEPYSLNLRHTANAVESVTFEWDFGDGNTSSSPDPQYVYTQPGTYTGYLLMYTTRGCIDSARYEFTVTIYPSPRFVVDIDPEKTDIFSPQVRVMVSGIDPDEEFVVRMGDGATYNNRLNVFHKYSDTGTYIITVGAVNNFGCVTEIEIPFRVAPIPLIYTPSAFSPNGDGMNDLFRSFSSGYKQFRFEIFDRWGNLVFQSFDAEEWWDGTDMNTGRDVQVGTYVWVVKFLSTEGEFLERKGTVTLMR